jgi:hypothetical protein
MTDVLMTCSSCDRDIAVHMETSVMRMDVEPAARAELLFRCPECGVAGVQVIVGDLLTLLLFVGVPPLTLSEPSLDPSDLPPPGPRFTPEDLLEWHETLDATWTVTPWEWQP